MKPTRGRKTRGEGKSRRRNWQRRKLRSLGRSGERRSGREKKEMAEGGPCFVV